ncbi:MAG: diphosphomevalonate decarboxylase [Deltaproteobacteria bacterium]|nr:diphosphomevalonate decarboxylase [Deltaproteobacteria bacterium]
MAHANTTATAYAQTNIALIKYWGKRHGIDAAGHSLNLPATGSLSMTLAEFGTQTTVELVDDDEDRFVLDGEEIAAGEAARVSAFLDLLRERAGNSRRCLVTSRNDVPTAAGLASSASAFAALTEAANAAFDLDLDEKERSILSRRGSGSAARSVFGGFVRMHKGELDDGNDSFAEPVLVHDELDLKLIVVQCAQGRKKIGSTVGMNRTSNTSPYFQAWIDTHDDDLQLCMKALAEGDFTSVGESMEHSTLKMHASAMAAQPGLWYFAPTSLAVLNEVTRLRDDGASCYFTMDAGPHVKVLCRASEVEELEDELAKVEGVQHIRSSAVGQGARVLEKSVLKAG